MLSAAAPLCIDELKKLGIVNFALTVRCLCVGTVIGCRRKCDALLAVAHANTFGIDIEVLAVAACNYILVHIVTLRTPDCKSTKPLTLLL